MSYGTPEPVISGAAYEVVAVDGHPPTDLDAFTGHARFSLRRGDSTHDVLGEGRSHEGGVRVHEKSEHADGKDLRIWEVTRTDDGRFEARHDAAF